MVEDLALKNKATNYFKGTANAVHIVQRCMFDEQGRRDTVDGYAAYDDEWRMVGFVSFDTLERTVKGGSVTPLLVVSYRDRLTAQQYEMYNQNFARVYDITGWQGVVVDGMDESKVQGFGIDAPMMDTLSTDDIIELLEGLKRVREQGEGGIGVRRLGLSPSTSPLNPSERRCSKQN